MSCWLLVQRSRSWLWRTRRLIDLWRCRSSTSHMRGGSTRGGGEILMQLRFVLQLLIGNSKRIYPMYVYNNSVWTIFWQTSEFASWNINDVPGTSGAWTSWRSLMVLGNSWASAKTKGSSCPQASPYPGVTTNHKKSHNRSQTHQVPSWKSPIVTYSHQFSPENFNWVIASPPRTSTTSHHMWTRC